MEFKTRVIYGRGDFLLKMVADVGSMPIIEWLHKKIFERNLIQVKTTRDTK